MVSRTRVRRYDYSAPNTPSAWPRNEDVQSRPVGEHAESAGTARGVKRFLVILAVLGSIQLIVMLGVEAHRAVEGQRAIARLHNDIAALEVEAAGLASIVARADDPTYREQLARRRGFVYPEEVRVVPLR